MAVNFLDTLNWRDTPQGRIPVYEDGTPMTPEDYDMLLEQHSQRADANRSRAAEAAAMRQAEADARAAQAQAEFNAGAGGVPWTASEMASGLSGAPRSNIPLDEELPIRSLKPEPVNLGENADDYGWTQVDSGEIERDPKTGKAKRAGAYTVAAPAPNEIRDIPLDGEGMDAMPAETVAPNARRREDLERAGYRRALKNSPDGTPTWVYTTRGEDGYTDSESMGLARRGANGRQMSEGMSGGTEYQRRARISRMADELGISEAEVRDMLSEGGELPRGQTPSATEIGYNSYAAFDPVREKIRDKRRTEKAQRSADAHAAVVRNAQLRQRPMEWFGNPTVTEDQKQMASAMLLQRGATPNDIDAFRQQMFLEGLRTGSRQNLNVTDPNSPTARAAAEAMELQNRQKRDEFRQGDEDVIGDKYAPSMGLLGYDEFTVAEQQQMYDDLIEQGYTPAEAQRAVDRQAKTRRATNRIRWGERGAAAPQATGGAPPGVHPITGQPFQGGPQAPAQQPSVNPITGLPF